MVGKVNSGTEKQEREQESGRELCIETGIVVFELLLFFVLILCPFGINKFV